MLTSVTSQVYVVIIIVSPRLLVPSPTENQYVCAKSPKKPLPLPSLVDPASVELSVVIPAYNEAERLTPMLEAAMAHLATLPGRTYEIIIVDDGSKDATVTLALSLARKHARADIRVVKMDHNVGKGGAVRHGALHARGARILMVDADGASRFSDLELLWKALDGTGNGVAVGSRAHMVETAAVVQVGCICGSMGMLLIPGQRSAVRNFLMHGFHFVLRTLGVGHIRDTQCGFKVRCMAPVCIVPSADISHISCFRGRRHSSCSHRCTSRHGYSMLNC